MNPETTEREIVREGEKEKKDAKICRVIDRVDW